MRIAIEGMDGCGKTTVSKILVEKLGYKYVDKSFKFLFESLNINESQLKDLEWKLYETEDEALLTLFYGLGLLYGTRCNPDQDVIYDRHFVSNYYWHGDEETTPLHKEVEKSIKIAVGKMRKALFYKVFAKIKKFKKVTKSLKNGFVHILST